MAHRFTWRPQPLPHRVDLQVLLEDRLKIIRFPGPPRTGIVPAPNRPCASPPILRPRRQSAARRPFLETSHAGRRRFLCRSTRWPGRHPGGPGAAGVRRLRALHGAAGARSPRAWPGPAPAAVADRLANPLRPGLAGRGDPRPPARGDPGRTGRPVADRHALFTRGRIHRGRPGRAAAGIGAHRSARWRAGRSAGAGHGRARTPGAGGQARRRSRQDLLPAAGRRGRLQRCRVRRPPGPPERGVDLEPGVLGWRSGGVARGRHAHRHHHGHGATAVGADGSPPPTSPDCKARRS